jgi:hypothetical protein
MRGRRLLRGRRARRLGQRLILMVRYCLLKSWFKVLIFFTGSVESQPEELLAVDSGRTIWTSPFTLPSRIIKKNHKTKRNWSTPPEPFYENTANISSLARPNLNLVLHSAPQTHDRRKAARGIALQRPRAL